MSSSSPPRTIDVRVVDTSLIFYVMALTFGQPFYGSRTVLSLPVSLEISTAKDYTQRVIH